MQDAKTAGRIRHSYRALWPEMDERMRRQWAAAAEARGLGYGGISRASRATGLSRTTDLATRVRQLAEKMVSLYPQA